MTDDNGAVASKKKPELKLPSRVDPAIRLAQPRRGSERQGLRALTVARDGAQRARVARHQRAPLGHRHRPHRAARPAHRVDPRRAHRSLRPAPRLRRARPEIADLDTQIRPIVEHQAPQLLNEVGISHTTATRLLIAWSHPGRFPTEAAFARLAGVAPIRASSGQHTRHRLNRGGDRQLNRAIHAIVITRCRVDPATRNYLNRRIVDGKTPREARRCLKRYTARRIFRLLEHPPTRA